MSTISLFLESFLKHCKDWQPWHDNQVVMIILVMWVSKKCYVLWLTLPIGSSIYIQYTFYYENTFCCQVRGTLYNSLFTHSCPPSTVHISTVYLALNHSPTVCAPRSITAIFGNGSDINEYKSFEIVYLVFFQYFQWVIAYSCNEQSWDAPGSQSVHTGTIELTIIFIFWCMSCLVHHLRCNKSGHLLVMNGSVNETEPSWLTAIVTTPCLIFTSNSWCVCPPPLVHREQPGSDQTSTDLLKCSRKFRWSKEAQYLYLRRLSSRSYSAIMMVSSYVMSDPNAFP